MVDLNWKTFVEIAVGLLIILYVTQTCQILQTEERKIQDEEIHQTQGDSSGCKQAHGTPRKPLPTNFPSCHPHNQDEPLIWQ